MNDVDLAARAEWSAADAKRLATGWLQKFETALASRDAEAIAGLFQPDSHWRDLLAFTWSLTSTLGATNLARLLADRQGEMGARSFRLAASRTPPRRARRLGFDVIEAIFEFETALGRGDGVVRLVADPP